MIGGLYILRDGLDIQDDELRCQRVKVRYDEKDMEGWYIGVEQRMEAGQGRIGSDSWACESRRLGL